MALTDRDIIITPNRGASTEPTILFRGADASSSASITLRVLNSGTIGTLSFEGTSGQLFSLTDSMSGTIFSANDVSGIPSIEVLDTGLVKIAQYSGNLQIGGSGNYTNATSTITGVLQVVGGAGIARDVWIGGNINIAGTVTAGSISSGAAVTSATNVTITNDPSSGSTMYPTFVNATSGISGVRVDSDGFVYIPGSNRIGLGITNPSYQLSVITGSDVWHAQFGTSGGKQLRIGGSTTYGSVIGAYNTDDNSSPSSLLLQRDGGNVGIGTSNPGTKLTVAGSGVNQTTALVDLQVTGSGTFQRGVRLLNSGMAAGNSLIYQVGQADSGRNAGQMYFVWNGAASTSNRLSFGLHQVDDVLNLAGTGYVGINATAPATNLHIQSASDTTLRIDSTNSTSDPQILLTDNNNAAGEGTRILYDSSVGDTYFNNIYTIATDAFHFQKGAYGSGTELLKITMAGNVIKGVHSATMPSVTFSDTAPTGRFDGDLWWETDTGRLKIQYNDGSSTQWVDALPIPDVGNFYSKAGGAITGSVTINGPLDVSGLTTLNNVYVAGTITAASFSGSISASTITVTAESASSSNHYPTFVSATGTPALKADTSKFIYRPSDGRLTLSSAVIAPSGIFAATTGAPDSRIWAVSADQYPNYGIFYNEGSPDYIEFQAGGGVYSRIGLDDGAAHFGLNGGLVGINTNSPATKLNILQGAGDATYGTAALRIGGTSNYASLELGIKGGYDGMISTYGNDLHVYSGNWRGVGNTASENHNIWFYTSQNGSTNWNTAKWKMQYDGQLLKGTRAVPSIIIQDAAPAGQFVGDLWWESDTGKLKVYYFNGSSYQWVDANPNVDTTLWYPRAGGTISGAVSIAQSLTVGQWITAVGEITAYYSDRRLKTNVKPIERPLEKVLSLNGITYNPNEVAGQYGFDTSVDIVGLFADEVEAVQPQAVKPAPFDTDEAGNSKSGENYKTVQYEKLVPLLVEAMKEQQELIKQMQGKIASLEEQLGKRI